MTEGIQLYITSDMRVFNARSNCWMKMDVSKGYGVLQIRERRGDTTKIRLSLKGLFHKYFPDLADESFKPRSGRNTVGFDPQFRKDFVENDVPVIYSIDFTDIVNVWIDLQREKQKEVDSRRDSMYDVNRKEK